jgi:membrane-bound ClpP family serine protease
MEWTIVISLVAIGLVLLLIEILFVPGTTLVGILGFIVLGIGVGLSFKYFGTEVGWITLGSTAVAAGLTLYISFKSNLWSRFALNSSNTGKVNEDPVGLSVGDEGVTLSALRPIGKAEIGRKTFEVKTLGSYVEAGQRVRIIQLNLNQIFVEPIT